MTQRVITPQIPTRVGPSQRPLVAADRSYPPRIPPISVAGDGSDGNVVILASAQLNNSALSFDGCNDNVTITDDAAIQDIFAGGGTVEAWIKPRSDGEGDLARVVRKRDPGWDTLVRESDGVNVKLDFFSSWSTSNGQWRTGLAIPLNEWTHVAVTYNSDSSSNDPIIYINGTPATLSEINTPSGSVNSDVGSDLMFGNRSAGDLTFDGFIDEVRLWDDIRTQQEVQDNKDTHLDGTEAGLVGYWNLNEESGSTATDSTANSNDGTITGATYITSDLPFNEGLESPQTLTRDMFYNNLTIESGAVLQPDGFAVHVRRLLINNGTIRRNGNDGSGEIAGAALSTNHYGGSGAGGGGGAGVGSSVDPGKGGDGGAGGDGDAGSGGAGGIVTAPVASESGFRVPPSTITLIDKNGTEVLGGAGGGAGNRDTSPATSPGAGGSGGGVLGIFATVLRNEGVIQANGGDGDDAGIGGGNAGGGGGGGGGWVVLVYGLTQNIGTVEAVGGTGGTSSGTGTNGEDGSAGEVLETQL